MVFVVITGNDRKEFEKLREALSYATIDSRIYNRDAFGNLEPLDKEKIEGLLKYEPIIKRKNDEVEQVEPDPHRLDEELVHIDTEKKTVDTSYGKNQVGRMIFRYVLYLIIICIILFVAYLILAPGYREFVAQGIKV